MECVVYLASKNNMVLGIIGTTTSPAKKQMPR